MKKWLMVAVLGLGVAVPALGFAATAAAESGASWCPCCF